MQMTQGEVKDESSSAQHERSAPSAIENGIKKMK